MSSVQICCSPWLSRHKLTQELHVLVRPQRAYRCLRIEVELCRERCWHAKCGCTYRAPADPPATRSGKFAKVRARASGTGTCQDALYEALRGHGCKWPMLRTTLATVLRVKGCSLTTETEHHRTLQHLMVACKHAGLC